jgi:hypothetical protein
MDRGWHPVLSVGEWIAVEPWSISALSGNGLTPDDLRCREQVK